MAILACPPREKESAPPWDGNIKKKPDGKNYYVGECKGCKEVVAGVVPPSSDDVSILIFRSHGKIERPCVGVFKTSRVEHFGRFSACKETQSAKDPELWCNHD